jgi:hypothetical protein
MLTFRGRVRFNDGNEVEFSGGTAALAAYEAYAVRNGFPVGEKMPPTLAALAIAHFCLHEKQGFDAWRQTVFGVELEADGVPPTLPEASAISGSG